MTFVGCDVTVEDDVKALVEATVEQYGRLDAAFNNAGIVTAPSELPDVSGADYEKTMAVNLDGVWFCLKYELAQMRERHRAGGGRRRTDRAPSVAELAMELGVIRAARRT